MSALRGCIEGQGPRTVCPTCLDTNSLRQFTRHGRSRVIVPQKITHFYPIFTHVLKITRVFDRIMVSHAFLCRGAHDAGLEISPTGNTQPRTTALRPRVPGHPARMLHQFSANFPLLTFLGELPYNNVVFSEKSFAVEDGTFYTKGAV